MDRMMTKEELTHDKIQAEIANLLAETAKLNAETAKINRERWWYPIAISTGFVVGIITLTKLFL